MSERIILGAGRRAMRRILTSKSGPKDYYKGTGSGAMGEHTKHGKYSVDPSRIRQFIVPSNFNSFLLKPYVSHKTPKIKEEPLTVDSFLRSNESNGPLLPPITVLERPPIRVPNIVKKATEEILKDLIREDIPKGQPKRKPSLNNKS